MDVPLLPAGLSDLQQYLRDMEDRVALLETPQGPRPLFRLASTGLTVANAAMNTDAWVLCPDLKTFAYSTGSHWVRIDTGATIV